MTAKDIQEYFSASRYDSMFHEAKALILGLRRSIDAKDGEGIMENIAKLHDLSSRCIAEIQLAIDENRVKDKAIAKLALSRFKDTQKYSEERMKLGAN